MQEKIVSVIVPMHNGEKYIKRCIDSVLNQSYKDIELLIVDDNSDDSCADIIEKYLLVNSNVRYIKNTQTLGPAETRNIGLRHVDSEYVLFLDCDDWLDLNCIEKAINKFSSDSDIDIVLWEIKTAYQYNKISSRYDYLYNNILSNTMALNLLSHTSENEFFLSPLLGCKLFKKSLLDSSQIEFPNTIYEDDMFTYLSFLYAKKVALITGSCLYYYQHPESLTHHFTEKHISDFFVTFKLLYEYIGDDQKETYYKYLVKCLHSMLNNLHSNISDVNIHKKYKTLIFTLFYENVNVEEYYTYSFSLTI